MTNFTLFLATILLGNYEYLLYVINTIDVNVTDWSEFIPCRLLQVLISFDEF